jgi:hypothetical protein
MKLKYRSIINESLLAKKMVDNPLDENTTGMPVIGRGISESIYK